MIFMLLNLNSLPEEPWRDGGAAEAAAAGVALGGKTLGAGEAELVRALELHRQNGRVEADRADVFLFVFFGGGGRSRSGGFTTSSVIFGLVFRVCGLGLGLGRRSSSLDFGFLGRRSGRRLRLLQPEAGLLGLVRQRPLPLASPPGDVVLLVLER